MAINRFFNKETASALAKGAEKAAGFASGVAGYFTGLGPQVEEAFSEATGKAANHSLGHMFANASAMSNENLIKANLATRLVEKAPEGEGVLGYKMTGVAKAAVVGLAGFQAIKGGVDESYKAKLGQVSPTTSALPGMEYDFSDIASKSTGADGNLVLALNKLRNG